MTNIISLLLAHIQELNNLILFLFNFIVKNIPLKSKDKDYSLVSPKYNKLKVDRLPSIHVPEKKDYKQLLAFIFANFLLMLWAYVLHT